MNIIKAYYLLNLKMLAKDKISFIWSIFFPSIIFIFNKNTFTTVLDMRFYWAYIIFSSYIFGIGLHALNLKERGCLKTYFSIKESRIEFFISNLLTQITFSFICISCFNLFSYLFIQTEIIPMFTYSFILIISAIPVAFLSCVFSLLSKIHYNSLNTVATIITTIFMFASQSDNILNYFNPLIYVSDILLINNLKDITLYLFTSLFFILIGLYSIRKYSIISNEVR